MKTLCYVCVYIYIYIYIILQLPRVPDQAAEVPLDGLNNEMCMFVLMRCCVVIVDWLFVDVLITCVC